MRVLTDKVFQQPEEQNIPEEVAALQQSSSLSYRHASLALYFTELEKCHAAERAITALERLDEQITKSLDDLSHYGAINHQQIESEDEESGERSKLPSQSSVDTPLDVPEGQ